MDGEVNNQPAQKARAALYVDGFNLYHTIEKLGENHLKWANLWKLGELLIKSHSETLVQVKYFTANRRVGQAASDRRYTYQNTLRSLGVIIVPGHYIDETQDCRACGAKWEKQSEKQTDINLALAVIMDGKDNAYDHAYVLSADSDHAATARVFKERLPDKRFVHVVPPGQKISEKVMNYTVHKIVLNKDHLERIVMPAFVRGRTGNLIRRPDGYAPRSDWIHPDQRPKKK